MPASEWLLALRHSIGLINVLGGFSCIWLFECGWRMFLTGWNVAESLRLDRAVSQLRLTREIPRLPDTYAVCARMLNERHQPSMVAGGRLR